MKAKDQVTFYDAIENMDLKDLEKILKILIWKKRTEDNQEKINMVSIAIEGKRKGRRYHEKL